MTRLIIATSNVQKRNKVSQVMYIGITSLVLRKAIKKIFSTSSKFDEEATATVYDVPLVIDRSNTVVIIP